MGCQVCRLNYFALAEGRQFSARPPFASAETERGLQRLPSTLLPVPRPKSWFQHSCRVFLHPIPVAWCTFHYCSVNLQHVGGSSKINNSGVLMVCNPLAPPRPDRAVVPSFSVNCSRRSIPGCFLLRPVLLPTSRAHPPIPPPPPRTLQLAGTRHSWRQSPC